MKTHALKFAAILLGALIGASAAARAHDPGLSSALVTLGPGRVEAAVTFARADIEGLGAVELSAIAPRALLIAQDGAPLRPAETSHRFDAQNNVTFRLAFARNGDGRLAITAPLIGELAFGHRQFLDVRDASGRVVVEQVLKADANTASIEPAESAGAPPAPAFPEFVLLGIEHILTGWDHLLFLAALLIVSRSLGDALKIITCFTLAHSLTLALATLNIVSLPSRVVEPLIAASIVYVAVENLVRRGEPRGRWLLTLSFGLVHGLGFASVLREMGIGANGGGVLLPLFSFNLGVELGQLAVAAVALPLILRLRTNPVWAGRWAPACSALVAMAGAYWLVERVVAG